MINPTMVGDGKMKTKKKFMGYIDEMGNMGLVNYQEHKAIKERIEKNPHLR